MKKSADALRKNLRTRLHLLGCALFRRYIYNDILKMVLEHGLQYRDVVGNIEPLQFARYVLGSKEGWHPSGLDFQGALGSAADFTPSDEPDFYNSEPSVGRFLGDIVYTTRPNTIVELGCFVGWTSAHLAYALKANESAGQIYCVDCSQHYLDVAHANLSRLGLAESITMIQGGSLDDSVLSRLPQQIDVLFIDTSHTYPDTLHEIFAYAPRLTPGGYMVLHDSLSWPGVRRSLIEVGPKFHILTFATEQGNGISVLLSPQAPLRA